MIKNIDIYEFRKIMQEKEVTILDTRDLVEYKERRVKKAINIDINNIDYVLNICPDKNKKILVYCTKGARSIVVAQRLDELGYTQIYNLEDGIKKILK